MVTFIIGLAVLVVGAYLYGKLCEKVFGPDDRKTPAYTKQDGIDYVPMKGWKNSLINLLNIAGTGPILGPIQGILFGPIAFITIPIGNIIGANLFNLVLVSGVSVTLAPFEVPVGKTIFGINSSLILDMPLMLVVMALLTIPALTTKKLHRWQGILLLCIYAAFCAIQFGL